MTGLTFAWMLVIAGGAMAVIGDIVLFWLWLKERGRCGAKQERARRRQLAIVLWGPIDGPIGATECELSHLPSDCPLCGAE